MAASAQPADVALEVKGGPSSSSSRTPLDEQTIKLKSVGGYGTLLRAQAERMPQVPSLTISYKDITLETQVPVRDPGKTHKP
jgi:hypothetical protein